MRTVVELVYEVHARTEAMGMDVSPAGVAFILNMFFEGMAAHDAENDATNEWLLMMAAEVNKVKDET